MVSKQFRMPYVGVAAVLITAATLLLYGTYYSAWTPVAVPVFFSLTEHPGSSETARAAACLEGVVTVEPGGRLGNLVLEYASAATVARRHHLRLAAPKGILQPLSRVFQGLSAEPLAQLLRQPPCQVLKLTEDQLLQNKSYRLEGEPSVEEAVKQASSRHFPVVLKKWIILVEYITPSFDYLRQEFKFQPQLKLKAEKKLATAKIETATSTGCNQTQVCTVGVHVRRTDYTEFMRKKFHLKKEAGVEYYREAAKAMLQDLRTECCAVAFVITSDDNDWCKANLLSEFKNISASSEPPSSAFLKSSTKAEDDFCLLASCQHLIMSYGTFGLSAAIFSGGRTIMYDTDKHGASNLPAAQMMASMVEHWRLIP